MRISRRSALDMTFVSLTALAALTFTGCESKQQKALDQAEKQAASTGQAQEVVSVDKNGSTTTSLVKPPTPGQKVSEIDTSTTPVPAGAPIPKPSGPTVSAVPVPPPPVDVSIPAGTALAIRIDRRISVKHSHAGEPFSGEVVSPVLASDNTVLVPKGSIVGGVVAEAHKRGHFKGRSILELRLTSLTLNGTKYPVVTNALERTKKGKGKRTAAMIGGGSGVGMLVGGLASGGVGLVVGGLAGGGAGTAVAGLTGNRDIEIPAESVVSFRLADDLVVQEQTS